MTPINVNKARTALLAVAVLLLLVPGSARADEETGWRLRFYLASLDFDVETEAGSSIGYDSTVGGGVGLNAEYRFSRRLGVDVGILGAGGFDISTRVQGPAGGTVVETDTLGFTPLSVGLDVHLTPDQRVDFYLSPLVAWIRYGSVSARTGNGFTATSIEADDDIAPGAALGLTVPIGQKRRWSFVAHLMYLASSLDGSGAEGSRLSSDNNTTVFGLGFGYRL